MKWSSGGNPSCWVAVGLLLTGACSSSDSGSNGSTPLPSGGPSTQLSAGSGALGQKSGATGGNSATSVSSITGTATGGATANKPPTGSGGSVAMPPASAGRGAATSGPTAGAMAAAAGAAAPVMNPPANLNGKTCLKAATDYKSPGPYQVMMKEVDLGMIEASQHTGKFMIYYPSPLETSCKHPIVAWGNGTGVQGSGVYTFLNSNAASYGMVVAESEEDNTGSGNFHKAGIDYLLKENMNPMSEFYGKLDTRAGVSGHSQGGFGASVGSAHPNVVTAAIEGAQMVASAKVSVLILTGTMDIVMNAENLVTTAKGPMFVADWEGGDHFTTETLGGFVAGDKGSLQFQRLYAAWFRCFLADDAVACKMFSGGAPANCGICKDMGWHGLASSNL